MLLYLMKNLLQAMVQVYDQTMNDDGKKDDDDKHDGNDDDGDNIKMQLQRQDRKLRHLILDRFRIKDGNVLFNFLQSNMRHLEY